MDLIDTQKNILRYLDFIRKINLRSWSRYSVKIQKKELSENGRQSKFLLSYSS